jgi:hypothetical protein
MNRTVYVVFTSLAALSLFSAAGCKVGACQDSAAVDGGKPVTKDNCIQFEPTIEYDGTARTANQAWTTGMGVTITNVNGNLTIDSTGATDVEVSGIPFTRDGTSDGEKANATAHLSAMAPPSVTSDASGIVISAPGGGFDGYKLTVHLPATFDGVLKASNGNGDLTYSGTPSSSGNTLHSDNGDVTATIGTGAKVTASAMTEFGTVVFQGLQWTMQMISPDMTSGSAVLGDGTGSIAGTTKNGDVFFKTQ